MDSTLAQLLNALQGNSTANAMPGGVSGARLAYMQGQNPIANQQMAGNVLQQRQQQQALAGMGNINPDTLYPGQGQSPQGGGSPPVSAMPPQGGASPNMSPAPNPPGVLQQVPQPGAMPMSQLSANQGQGGAIPPPPPPQGSPGSMSPGQAPSPSAVTGAAQQQMSSQNSPGAQGLSDDHQKIWQQVQQMSPEERQQMKPVFQTIQQGLQGPQGPQYKDIIAAVKEAMPNATPQARGMAVKMLMDQTNQSFGQQLKSLQEQIMLGKYGQAEERMGTNEKRLELAEAKSGLGPADATTKILNFAGNKSQATAAGNVGGRTNVARADAEAVLKGKAMQSALAYLPPDQNKLQAWIKNQGANFENSPQFAAFKAANLAAAGEIARALAGGGLPKAGLTTQIEAQLNNASDQQAYQAVVNSYLGTTSAAAGATEGVVQQGGGAPDPGIQMPDEGNGGSQVLKYDAQGNPL